MRWSGDTRRDTNYYYLIETYMHVRTLAGLVISIVFVATPVFADIVASVNVPDHCTVVDTDGVSHTYSGQYFGICALQAAVDSGAIAGARFSNAFPSFGLFVTSVGGVSADEMSQYWALYQNGNFASLGLSQLPVAEGDAITLELHDFSDTFLGSRFTLNISSLVSATLSASAAASVGGGIENIASDFDVTKAVLFLKSFQNADGALPEALLSDWAAFAFKSHDIGDARMKLREYFLRWKPALTKATDYERHAMALLALGIDPYIGTGTDYITPIVEAFDGTQVGDPSLINDDIFAVFPLLHAGYRSEDEMPRRIRDGIIAAQRPDGSWEGSVDLTAAAIQALSLFERTGATQIALSRADGYLSSQQAENGGFGNSFSTAWVLQAIAAIGDSHTIWAKQIYRTPRYYFSALQQKDGGVDTDTTDSFTRLWATAYAVPGVSGRTWDSLMEHFPKPAAATPEPISVAAVATTTATSTEAAVLMQATPEFTAAAIPAPEWATDIPDGSEEISPDPATSTAESQTAAVAGAVDTNGTWMWVMGLIAVFGTALYFLRFGR